MSEKLDIPKLKRLSSLKSLLNMKRLQNVDERKRKNKTPRARARTHTHTDTPVSYTHLDVYKRQA